jgi:iron complex transport system substrate-binding protein
MKRKRMRIKGSAAILCAVLMLALLLSACSGTAPVDVMWNEKGLGNGWLPESSMELQYAQNFSVDYYAGGYKLISIADGNRFLVVPENADVPEGIATDIIILKQPIDHIYLVATSALCLFDALDSLPSIAMSGRWLVY